jgi:hypothetical protein
VKRVGRDEIVDYVTYEDERDAFRERVLEVKRRRRIHVGDYCTFLFENPTTVRYQVQEMMRTERIVRERDVQHELDTYNALLGDEGELGCTLLIEIDDRAERDVKLREWLALPEHLYVRLEDGTLVRPRVDAGQRDDERLSSVQYLKFPVGGRVPVAVGIDLPAIAAETRLSDEQRAALAADLAESEDAGSG